MEEKIQGSHRSSLCRSEEPITAWLDLGKKSSAPPYAPGYTQGIEFSARDRNPIQVIYLSNGSAASALFAHVVCFLRAVEDAASIPVPPETAVYPGTRSGTRTSSLSHAVGWGRLLP